MTGEFGMRRISYFCISIALAMSATSLVVSVNMVLSDRGSYSQGCYAKNKVVNEDLRPAGLYAPSVDRALDAVEPQQAPAISSKAMLGKIQDFVGSAVEVTKTFDGPDGLTGVVVDAGSPGGSNTANPVVFWATENAEAFIFGDVMYAGQNLTDLAKGIKPKENVTDELKRAAAEAIDMAAEERQYIIDAMGDASGIMVGPDEIKRIAYVVFDPACQHCRTLYKEVVRNAQAINDAGIAIKWIPVDVMEEGADQAAFILTNGEKALNYIESPETMPAVPEFANVSSDARAAVQRNHSLFTENIIQPRVPTIVWRDNHGEVVVVGSALNQSGINALISGEPPKSEIR